jgi:enamine deaminase RidA (YjgF/YER057c/UK114 family)
LHIAGQIGWNGDQKFGAKGFIEQMEQALLNIRPVLETAGGVPSDLTRLTSNVTNKAEYMSKQKEVGTAYRRVFANNFPAMTLFAELLSIIFG